jgi:hypothetical protein
LAPQLSDAAEGKVRDSTPRSPDVYKLIYIYMLHTARIHVGLCTSNKCPFFLFTSYVPKEEEEKSNLKRDAQTPDSCGLPVACDR